MASENNNFQSTVESLFKGIDLEINALSTVMFIFVLLLVGIYYFITTKKGRKKNHRVMGGLVK